MSGYGFTRWTKAMTGWLYNQNVYVYNFYSAAEHHYYLFIYFSKIRKPKCLPLHVQGENVQSTVCLYKMC